MQATEFTPLLSAAGGGLIGLAAVLLMASHGRIAGISGMLQGLLPPYAAGWAKENLWRLAFLLGAVIAPIVVYSLSGWQPDFQVQTPKLWLIIGGVIVGAGVQLASGCTSGHSVCGIARLSLRSIVATVTFMITTAITVYIIRHLIGGF